MHTLRNSWWSGSARWLQSLALCAAWLTGSAVADALVMQPSALSTARAEGLHATKPRKGGGGQTGAAMPALPAAWSSAELVPEPWRRSDLSVLRRPTDLLTDDRYLASASGFDSNTLFRTRKEMKYRDTLRLLLTKRQLRVWLREDLHLQCEVKRYRSLDEGREFGVKLGLYYRFK